MTSETEVQIGKKGISPEFLEDLEKRFKKYQNKIMKIRVLKNARENKGDVKEYAKEIKSFLGEKFTYKIIGFSIFMRKWRKARVV